MCSRFMHDACRERKRYTDAAVLLSLLGTSHPMALYLRKSPHIGLDHGFVEYVRVVDDERTLLVVPERSTSTSGASKEGQQTSFEAWRPGMCPCCVYVGTSSCRVVLHCVSESWIGSEKRLCGADGIRYPPT